MYYRMGTAALVGILFLILIIPLQVWLGRTTSKLRIEAAKMTDHRLQLTQESLSAIRIIKMYTWEKFFVDRISKARKHEMKKVKQIYLARATFLEIGSLVTSLATYIIVIIFTKLGNKYTAEIDSFLAGCFHILRSPITTSIPLGIVNLAELVASVRRIHTVLIADEQKFIDIVSANLLIEIENVSVKMNDKEILQNINLKIESGLYFVTGKVGSGKSSLLKTIIQNYPTEKGEMNIQSTISYASQEPWLFPSSMKQNILFGQTYNKERYAKVLKVCALETYLASFLDGDETVIKDRGLNLSKGQQSRINLARAVYCDSDIYLLDDNLSSLDKHLQDFIYKECIKKLLGNKIVIIVSHNEKLIKQGDKIIIMDRGTIKSYLDSSEAEELCEFTQKSIQEELVIKQPEERNIYYEKKKEGKVDFNVLKRYCQHGGGILTVILILGLYVLAQVASVCTEKLLSTWVNIQQKISESSTNTTEFRQILNENETMSGYYTVAIVASIIFFFSRAYTHFKFASRASLILHNSMILSIVNATMKFFDLHYIGNILSRCAKDFSTIDDILPFNSYELLKFICRFIGTLILILQVNTLFSIPASIVIVLLLVIRNFYIPSGRSLKRLDSTTRSPVIGHVNASLEGLSIIKAHRNQRTLQREFDMHQNLYISANYMLQSSTRAFGYFLDLLCHSFTATIIIIFLFVGKNIQAGNVGLAIRQSLSLNGLLQWGIRAWAELESHMTSVERVLKYTNTEKESITGLVLENWPQKGKITFKNVNLTYAGSKDYILKNIDFTIQPGEKIGVVGRTGVGKTSLISLLFRLYDYQGTITIDNVDIRTLTLDFLRKNLSIIPQDPVLFSGTIRRNIDPTDCYEDEEIWEAITAANLKEFIPSLYTNIINGGSNFSSGQKQLICLAKAIIKNSKIVILDEATAIIDLETDFMIHIIIKQCFDSST